ncbi:MAG: TIGR01212 family radical SAM protein [Bacteroidia bacterium]
MTFNGPKRYNDYGSYTRSYFGGRIQKICVNAGFTCPNRDGSKGTGGCTYCNNNTFSPEYCKPVKSITEQLQEGIVFFTKRRTPTGFLAYFQSYSNTYANLEHLCKLYKEALAFPEVLGIVVSTRPDCVNEEVIALLASLAGKKYVSLELGVESTLDRTLDLIHRCHTFQDTIDAFRLAEGKGIHLGAHLILNLPGESKNEMLEHARVLSRMPVHSIKLHNLQIVKHTTLALEYKFHPGNFRLPDPEAYTELVTDFITLLRPDIVLERFTGESPAHLLLAPQWGGIKNFEMVRRIDAKLEEKGLWQGKNYTV